MADELRSRLSSAVGARYEISDEIGRGGMGVVFRARDVRLRRAVAIKMLPPELAFREEVRSRFLREAQTAAQLDEAHRRIDVASRQVESAVTRSVRGPAELTPATRQVRRVAMRQDVGGAWKIDIGMGAPDAGGWPDRVDCVGRKGAFVGRRALSRIRWNSEVVSGSGSAFTPVSRVSTRPGTSASRYTRQRGS